MGGVAGDIRTILVIAKRRYWNFVRLQKYVSYAMLQTSVEFSWIFFMSAEISFKYGEPTKFGSRVDFWTVKAWVLDIIYTELHRVTQSTPIEPQFGAMTCQKFCDNLEIQNLFQHIVSVNNVGHGDFLRRPNNSRLSLIPARKNNSVRIFGKTPQKCHIKLKW